MAQPRNMLSTFFMALPSVARETPGVLKRVNASDSVLGLPHLAAFQSPRVNFQQLAQSEVFPVVTKLANTNDKLLRPVQEPLEEGVLSSEADVITHSHNPIIHPVTLLLAQFYGGSPHAPGLRVRYRQEIYKDLTRVDLAWEYILPGASDWTVFAILEYKGAHVIEPHKFSQRHYGVVTDGKGKLRPKEWFLKTAGKGENPFTFGNPGGLTKQILQYADRTPYIALFDWETLILADFSHFVAKGKDANFVEMKIVQETKADAQAGNSMAMNLLGFVHHALEQALQQRGLDPKQL